MKNTLYITSLIIVITLTSCQNSFTSNHAAASEIQLDIPTAVQSMQLPDDVAIPETLPTTIQDATLLEAWIHLSNSTRTCEVWDGDSVTGQELAQYVIDQAVIIDWNTNPKYLGSWVDRNKSKVIHINPAYKEDNAVQMTKLVRSISHELMHHRNPFHQKADSLYEEYWAFYVGACVSGQSLENFAQTSPLSSASLTGWFNTNGYDYYLGEYEMYPEKVMAISLP